MATNNILEVEQKKTDFDNEKEKTKVLEMRILAQNKSDASISGNSTENPTFIKAPFSKIVKQNKSISPKDFLK